MCASMHHAPALNEDDLVSYILPDIYRKTGDKRIDEFISIRIMQKLNL